MTVTPAGLSPDEQVEFFFASPVPLQEPVGGYRSPLHLLRRELQDCLVGRHFDDEQEPVGLLAEHRRFMATALVIWSGIDLLAKFHSGEPDSSGVGRKFKQYVRELIVPRGGVGPDVENPEEVLYQGMRNPMSHAFNMNGHDFDVVLHCRKAPTFVIVRMGTTPGLDYGVPLPDEAASGLNGFEESIAYERSRPVYHVNLSGVYVAFLQSISAYRNTLRDAKNRERFSKAFRSLGCIAHS